jgi:hypothetical protein
MSVAREGTLSAPAIGCVCDERTWFHAAVLVRQLVDAATKSQIVVFSTIKLPEPAADVFARLGAELVPLAPAMPVPADMRYFFIGTDGKPIARRHSPWQKLAVWAQTRWSKIVLLDVDLVVLRNIDEMAQFPADTFSPEACGRLDHAPPFAHAARCSELVTGGFNAGAMVLEPSRQRFEQMARYADQQVAQQLRMAGTNRTLRTGIELSHLAFPEQSFLGRFFWDVRNASLHTAGGRPSGYLWQPGPLWRDLEQSRVCESRTSFRESRPAGCTSSRVGAMSRLYNARLLDCAGCPRSYAQHARLVHFTCGPKPWARSRAGWEACGRSARHRANATAPECAEPCAINWVLKWFDAHAAVCSLIKGASAALLRHAHEHAVSGDASLNFLVNGSAVTCQL